LLCGLTIPILHDTFHAVTHDVCRCYVNGATYGLRIEKRNNKLGATERPKGTRYAVIGYKVITVF